MAANKKAPQKSAGEKLTGTAEVENIALAPAEQSTPTPTYVGVGGGAPGGGPPGEGLHQREAGPNRPR